MKKKLLQKSAFTLMELLIGVGIMVVLLAVAIPSFTNLSSKFKMRELDNYAKTIYLEAQNQLITKKAEGGLAAFDGIVRSGYSDQNVDQMPTDFNAGLNGEGWRNLFYLNEEDSLLAELIPGGLALEGSVLVELDPTTGSIYGVFYREGDSAISYAEIKALADRSIEERRAAGFGYYGGELENVAEASFTLEQTVNVVNSEELYVVVSYKANSFLNRSNYNDGRLSVKLKITDEHGYWRELELNSQQLENVQMTGSYLKLYILLDSMMEGYSFNEITANPDGSVSLYTGNNMTIKVTSTFNSGSIHQVQTGSVSANSMFADVKRNEGGYDEIYISSTRHLKNLSGTKYGHVGNTPKIIQTEDIDFERGNFAWEIDSGNAKYTGHASNPLSVFEALQNPSVFHRQGETSPVYEGRGNLLKGFHVVPYRDVTTGADTDCVGIIGSTKEMLISGVNVQDVRVTAGARTCVGGFVGQITGGSVTECGVYLSTVAADGTHYSSIVYDSGIYTDKMDERYHTYTVNGGESTGGFCGEAIGASFTDCFSAVKVMGTKNVGGFCGYAHDSASFTNCYSSGNVTADSQAGGMVAYANNNVSFHNCYTSGVIEVADIAGGMVAYSEGSHFDSCSSYAKLTGVNGVGMPEWSGAFLNKEYSRDDTTYRECIVLKQDGYNKNIGEDDSAVAIKSYYDLDDGIIRQVRTFPYSSVLQGQTFPFPTVISSGRHVNSHYGNWQGQYVIDTSLVYYERYKDDSYGYYCVTTLSNVNSGEENDYTWVLDTLQNKIVVEDGYGLLTIYNLKSFDYTLNIGSVTPEEYGQTKYDDNTHTGHIEVSDTYEPGKAKMVRHSKNSLVFEGYEGNYDSQTNFTIMGDADATFSISDMYLYQLPYELQATDRSLVNKFYDRLIIENGISPNGNQVVLAEELTFYYCPHFARTAINPAIEKNNLVNPDEVYVRSAKQLNALGRFPYYWNTKLGYTDKIHFVQETDISFSDYVTIYCGVEFNLMDTSVTNTVRNCPIGQPVPTSYLDWLYDLLGIEINTSDGQFNNHYDGRGNRIIDYRISSSNQFVGLFGEIELSEIKNVVMTVSEVYNPNNPTSKGGYVHGTHANSDKVAAVGCLIGVSYHRGNTVENCATSGYEVKYISADDVPFRGVSVGGLIGISMSDTKHCTACCDVRVDLKDFRDDDWFGSENIRPITMGGLIGSQYYNGVSNCYAGGTINISIQDHNDIDEMSGLAAGGISGALMIIPSKEYPGLGSNVDNPVYQNCYSYTRVLIGEQFNATTVHVAPIAPKVRFDLPAVSLGDLFLSWIYNVSASSVSINNSKYLDTSFNGRQDAGEFTVEREVSEAYGAASRSLFELRDEGFVGMGEVRDAAHTFAHSVNLEGKKYNLPAVIKDMSGTYVHYGDWPYFVAVEAPDAINEYVGYYEKYSDGTEGFYYVDYDETIVNTLKVPQWTDAGYTLDVEIVDTAYVTMKRVALMEPSITRVSINDIWYYVYEDKSINMASDQISTSRTVTYELVKAGTGEVQTNDITLYMNPYYGAAISIEADLGKSADNPLKVRTLEQLKAVNNTKGSSTQTAYIQLDLNVHLPASATSLQINEYCDFDGGRSNGLRIRNAAGTIFGTNNGTIHNAWSVDAKDAFVGINNGTIDNCLAEEAETINVGFVKENNGSITNSIVKNCINQVAGFAQINKGRISGCSVYAEGSSDANRTDGMRVAGFVYTNEGTIENSYVNGTVKSLNEAAGFVMENTGEIKNSGTTESLSIPLTVTGKNVAGFAYTNHGTIESCGNAATVNGSETVAGFVMENIGDGVIRNSGTKADAKVPLTVTGKNAAGFVYTNQGKIDVCSIVATVSGSDAVAGFVMTNTEAGNINNSAAQKGDYLPLTMTGKTAAGFVHTNQGAMSGCSVTGTVNGSDVAAGFVYTNESESVLSSCYVIDSTVNGTNLAVGFALNNSTTIENCGVRATSYSNVMITGKKAVGFIADNTGDISKCFATGTIDGVELAAGFVQNNSKNISSSYANCQTTAEQNAYGFAVANDATIQNCYSAGLVKSESSSETHSVYGFGSNNDKIENCYSICDLVSAGAKIYGFSDKDKGTVTECYWGYSKHHNMDVHEEAETNSSGTKLTLLELSDKTSLGILAKDSEKDEPYSTEDIGDEYPYPAVADMVFYGNWSKPEGVILKKDYITEDDYIGIFYYEVYEDGVAGGYGIGYKQSDVKEQEERNASGFVSLGKPIMVFNTLAYGAFDREEDIKGSGYGVFYADGSDPEELGKWLYKDNKINEKVFNTICKSENDVSHLLTNNEGRYKLYTLDGTYGDALTSTLSRHFGQALNAEKGKVTEAEVRDLLSGKPGMTAVPDGIIGAPDVNRKNDTTYTYLYNVSFTQGANTYTASVDAHNGDVYDYVFETTPGASKTPLDAATIKSKVSTQDDVKQDKMDEFTYGFSGASSDIISGSYRTGWWIFGSTHSFTMDAYTGAFEKTKSEIQGKVSSVYGVSVNQNNITKVNRFFWVKHNIGATHYFVLYDAYTGQEMLFLSGNNAFNSCTITLSDGNYLVSISCANNVTYSCTINASAQQVIRVQEQKNLGAVELYTYDEVYNRVNIELTDEIVDAEARKEE